MVFTTFRHTNFFPFLRHFTWAVPDFATEPTLAHVLPGELDTVWKEIAYAVGSRLTWEITTTREKRRGRRFMSHNLRLGECQH